MWDESKSGMENIADEYSIMSRDNLIIMIILFIIAGIIYLIKQ